MPIYKKIEGITKMAPPNLRKEVQKFIGVINYYRDMWSRRLHTLVPLTISISIKRKYKWTQVKQYAFNKIGQIVAHDNLLCYPDFNENFKIRTDASAFQ